MRKEKEELTTELSNSTTEAERLRVDLADTRGKLLEVRARVESLERRISGKQIPHQFQPGTMTLKSVIERVPRQGG